MEIFPVIGETPPPPPPPPPTKKVLLHDFGKLNVTILLYLKPLSAKDFFIMISMSLKREKSEKYSVLLHDFGSSNFVVLETSADKRTFQGHSRNPRNSHSLNFTIQTEHLCSRFMAKEFLYLDFKVIFQGHSRIFQFGSDRSSRLNTCALGSWGYQEDS